MVSAAGIRASHATALAALLTLATGAVDAMTFLRLGGVFSSVMTGNIVVLGASTARRDVAQCEHAALAIAGFVAGTLAGSRLVGGANRHRPVWPQRVNLALSTELVLLLGMSVGWWLGGARPAHVDQFVVLALAASAMGVRSAAVRAVGVANLSTTYLTGTLVGLVAELTTDNGVRWRAVLMLVALFVGSASGGTLVIDAGQLAPVLPLGLLAVVLSVGLALTRGGVAANGRCAAGGP